MSPLICVKVLVKVSLVSISHIPMFRNHLSLHHRYPIGFALFPLFRAPGSMPGSGARVQNLGHL